MARRGTAENPDNPEARFDAWLAGKGEELPLFDHVRIAVERELAAQGDLRTGEEFKELFTFARFTKGHSKLAGKTAADAVKILTPILARIAGTHDGPWWVVFPDVDDPPPAFALAWPKIKTPGGTPFLQRIVLFSQAHLLHVVAPIPSQWYDRVVSFAGWLAVERAPDPFYLSARTAGQLLGCSHTTAFDCLHMAEETGLLAVKQRGGLQGGSQRATLYTFDLQRFPELVKALAERGVQAPPHRAHSSHSAHMSTGGFTYETQDSQDSQKTLSDSQRAAQRGAGDE